MFFWLWNLTCYFFRIITLTLNCIRYKSSSLWEIHCERFKIASIFSLTAFAVLYVSCRYIVKSVIIVFKTNINDEIGIIIVINIIKWVVTLQLCIITRCICPCILHNLKHNKCASQIQIHFFSIIRTINVYYFNM